MEFWLHIYPDKALWLDHRHFQCFLHCVYVLQHLGFVVLVNEQLMVVFEATEHVCLTYMYTSGHVVQVGD